MKNLILSVLAVILVSLPVNFVAAEEAPRADTSVAKSTMPIPPFAPVVWKIRKGENLTRIAERYNLSIQSILEPNEGGACIKNKDKIFAGCEIIIPVYPLEQIEKYADDQKALVEKAVAQARVEGEDKANFTVSLFVFAFLASVLLLLVIVAAFNALKKRMKKAENEKTDLSNKLWAAEDKIKKMEIEKEDFEKMLVYQRSELVDTGARVIALNQALATKITAGDNVSVLSKDNGKIDLKVLKVELESGVPEVYVECTAKEPDCLSNKNHDLKLKNALSHLNVHGTSQDLKPNGWTE